MNLILILDTSICGLAMGLVEVTNPEPTSSSRLSKISWSYIHVEAAGAAKSLSDVLTSGLKRLGRNQADIAGILVSNGPGSFTGIRVGLAFASGIQAGSGRQTLPIVGVSSLQLLAEALAKSESGPVVAALSATKMAGYIAVSDLGEVTTLYSINFENPAELPSIDFSKSKHFICGEWPEFSKNYPVKLLSKSIEIAAVAEKALYGMSEYCGRIEWEGVGDELPGALYLRRSTVEERFARGGK